MEKSSFYVVGRPAPKGSYTAVQTRAGQRFLPQSRYEKDWRLTVDARARAWRYQHRENNYQPADSLTVRLTFFLDPPKRMPKGRRHPVVPPDIDKLARSTLDGLVDSGLIPDDKQVIKLEAKKLYAEYPSHPQGCWIEIQPYQEKEKEEEGQSC